MALGWLAAFSDEAAASFSMLKRAAKEGISADLTHRFLKASGIELPREEVREIIGRLRFDAAVKEYIDALSNAARPLKQFIPETATNLTKTYKYTLEVTSEHLKTGAVETSILSLTSDTLLSKSAAAEKMIEAVSTRNGEPYRNVTDVNILFIERRAD
jgi:hypothetical protein